MTIGQWCSVDVPDTACHWYVVSRECYNTFGEGFSMDETYSKAPWFSVEGLRDIGELHDTMTSIQQTEQL